IRRFPHLPLRLFPQTNRANPLYLRRTFWKVTFRGGSGKFAVPQPVSHIDHNADGSPDDESNPGQLWEKTHEAEEGQHPQNGDERHEGKPEWADLAGFRVAQDHDTDTDEDKSKESADIRHIRRIADGDKSSECGHADAGENSRIVGRAIAWMYG